MTARGPLSRAALAVVGVLAGCAGNGIALSGDVDADGTVAEVDSDGVDLATDASWYVRVEPSEADPPEGVLLPQAYGPFVDARQLTLALRPAVRLRGTAIASVTERWPGVLPTTPIAVDGSVRFIQESSGDVVTAPLIDGAFTVDAPPGSYIAQVLPTQALVPVWRVPLDIVDDADLRWEAPDSAPVWGQVTDANGQPVPNARVQVLAPTGEAGARTLTDADGWYELRAVVGAYRVVVSHPTDRLPALLGDAPVEDADGARADVSWSDRALTAFSLRLTTPDGEPIASLPVALTSETLDGYLPGAARFSVEVNSDSRGFVDALVPPGAYRVEVAPGANVPFAARVRDAVEVRDGVGLADLVVPAFRDVALPVDDPNGVAVGGAVLACRETAGQLRTFNLRADDDGVLRGALPDTVLDCLVAPPGSRRDLASQRVIEPLATLQAFTLRGGTALSGAITVVGPAGIARPAPFAVVRVTTRAGDLLAQTVTDDRGSFAVRVELP